MNKQTQMYLGAAVVAVAGYFLWKEMADKKAAASKVAFAGIAGDKTKEFTGKMSADGSMPVGVSQNATIVDSAWGNADGGKGFHK